jgi:hypothetical protein
VLREPSRQRVGYPRERGRTPSETLAEYFEDEGFVLPMTIAVVDQRNEAIKVTIAASGEKTWH